MTWIPIDRELTLPDYVTEAIRKLKKRGFTAYVVGGSVRDFLLKRNSKDHDLATDARPDDLIKCFPKAITVGKAFGVIKVPVDGPLLEIATFRTDLEYENHRHPKKVRFLGPWEDAQRRDFTINALFYDPEKKQILDCVGGREDLDRGVIAAIGNPLHRFEEDALRLLRAVRFSASLGFKIETKTAEALKKRARLIDKVSHERVRDELNQMLMGWAPAEALELLSKHGLLVHILPELEKLRGVEQSPLYPGEGDLWQHTRRCMEILSQQNIQTSHCLVWGTLLHEIGKPNAARRSKGENFNNHEIDGAQMASRICKRLKMSKIEMETIVALIADYQKFSEVFRMREATLQRWIRKPYFEDLLALHRVDATASDGNLAAYEFCLSRLREVKKQPQAVHLIDGDDLIQLGLDPSPRFSQILREVENLALEKRLKNKEDALEFVVKHYI